MNKPINILDKDYLKWVKELCKRYRQSQIKAAVKVNHVVLQFYWDLGKDICNKEAENKYGSKFYATLSRDLRNEIPDAEGLSERNLRYTKKFYQLYNQKIKILQQIAANSVLDFAAGCCKIQYRIGKPRISSSYYARFILSAMGTSDVAY